MPQHQSAVYSGTFDAFRKILKSEGVRGFYRGFWVSSFQVVSGIAYVSTYEGVRHVLGSSQLVTDTKVRAFLGGAAASVVGQTIIVPFDVISQGGNKIEILNTVGISELQSWRLSIKGNILTVGMYFTKSM